MEIECILHRKDGTVVELGGVEYHFKPRPDGRHIAVVEDEDHIGRFLSISEGYRIAKKVGAGEILAKSIVKPKEPGSVGDLTIKHIGRGKFAIMRGDDRVSEHDSKDEANAALEKLLAGAAQDDAGASSADQGGDDPGDEGGNDE